MAKQITGIITWLKGWFYDKTEITGFLNNKANVSDLQTTNGNITALQSRVSTLESFEFIKVTSTKPTPSASTMNTLYIVSETVNNVAQVNVYYTKATTNNGTTTYSLEKMDTDILDSLSINWSDINGKPNSFTPSSHTHGNITNEGKIGNTMGRILTTGSNGTITTSDSITKDKISDFSHSHGNISSTGTIENTTDGQLNYDEVAVGDYAVVVDKSDNNKIKKGYIPSGKVAELDATSLTNIDYDSAHPLFNGAPQSLINEKIDAVLGLKASYSEVITSIELIPKSSNSTGAIKLYFGDESTTGHGTDWTDLT